MNAKTHDPAPGSGEVATEPSQLDYQAWVDGLTDRAGKVSADGLAAQARDVAKTADRLVQARLNYDLQSKRTAPGARGPATAMVVKAFNDQLQAQVAQLATTCKE